ncbi:MAG: 3-phosphoshikimate 1-carboxyvinyltransferase [Bacteroidota bacterium]
MISINAPRTPVRGEIPLAASKSESNRALIIQALGGPDIALENLASARDTQTMIRLLSSDNHVLDVIDAGTTMRFLTAYLSAVDQDQLLTGTPRMCNRPIGILVDALRELGAEIKYWKQEGYPPLHIMRRGSPLKGGSLSIAGNVSSQYISAILMIAPTLKQGLTLTLEGAVSSRPYIEMTLALMEHFGITHRWEDAVISIEEQAYQGGTYTIESDWSAASYWYAVAAIAPEADLKLLGLREQSFQGDRGIVELMRHFGVESEFDETGVRLIKTTPLTQLKPLNLDFTKTPDLAQTIGVVSAATGIPVRMTGLHTLRIKETDRIAAMQTELAKFGVDMLVEGDICTIQGQAQPSKEPLHTYEDHRMAMAFAPLAWLDPESSLTVDDEEVVQKSYPEYWDHLQMVGLSVTSF